MKNKMCKIGSIQFISPYVDIGRCHPSVLKEEEGTGGRSVCMNCAVARKLLLSTQARQSLLVVVALPGGGREI